MDRTDGFAARPTKVRQAAGLLPAQARGEGDWRERGAGRGDTSVECVYSMSSEPSMTPSNRKVDR